MGRAPGNGSDSTAIHCEALLWAAKCASRSEAKRQAMHARAHFPLHAYQLCHKTANAAVQLFMNRLTLNSRYRA